MPERLTTTGRTYQDPPKLQGTPYVVSNDPSSDDLKGTAYDGAAIVGSEDGFFSTGSQDQGQVVIAGGVNGKAVSLSLGSVLPPGVLARNEVFSIKAAAQQSDLTEKIQGDGNFRLQNGLIIGGTRAGEAGEDTDFGEAGVLAERRDKRNTKEEQDNVIKKFDPLINNPKYKSKYYNRYLENRSCLIFIDGPKKIVLPFFENPRIEEKRVSNYESTTNPGGATPFLFYKFTEFSNIKISFKMNAMHIAEILLKEGIDLYSFLHFTDPKNGPNPNPDKDKFFSKLESIKKLLSNCSNEYFTTRVIKTPLNVNNNNSAPILDDQKENISLYESIKPYLNFYGKNLDTHFNQALTIMLLWIYTIKNFVFFTTSTGITNAEQAQRLAEAGTDPQNQNLAKTLVIKHGPVYYYLPCLLINYEIKEVQNSTYDIESVMALNYEVTLTVFARPENWKGVLSNLGISNDDTGSIILFDNDTNTSTSQQVTTGGSP